MEDQNVYVIDDHDWQQEETLNEPSKRDCRNNNYSGHVYMVMNAVQLKLKAVNMKHFSLATLQQLRLK